MYTPLRVRSAYSILQSTIKIDSLLKFCKTHNMPSVGVVDTKHMHYAAELSIDAMKNGIKPLFGLEVTLSPNDTRDHSRDKVTIFAKNQIGMQSILHISSQEANMGYFPINELLEHKANIVFIINHHMENAMIEQISHQAYNNTYAGVEQYDMQITKHTNDTINMAHQYKIPVVAFNESLFIDKDDVQIHKVLTCIQEKNKLETIIYHKQNLYIRTLHEMQKAYHHIPIALENTNEIAMRCSAIIQKKPIIIPEITKNSAQILKADTYTGLAKRNMHTKSDYIERLDYELGIVNNMGFANYFLIVADFVKYALDNDIPVGPGRGSGAGSLIAWTLGITNIDPIRMGLFFERFLNPDRVSMPDIDIDFCRDKRNQVIDYISKKYGYDRIAHIITFGILHSKSVIKDVGRALNINYNKVHELSQLIPYTSLHIPTLKESIEKGYIKYQTLSAEMKGLCDVALKLEGLIRNKSIHAAGIIISNEPIQYSVPLIQDFDTGHRVSQYTMKYIEMLGMLKFDFLGLSTLTVIQTAKSMLKNQGIKYLFNDKFQDTKTYDLISSGHTTGIFQLESLNMKGVLRAIKPQKFSDIMATISLYRPGPMENIPQYIEGKENNDVTSYAQISKKMNTAIRPILKETYGVIIYQEQVMEIARKIAGFSLARADTLRKAIGKKVKEEMQALKTEFTQGIINNGFSKKDAENMFLIIEKFAGYGFNKSHAASYAYLAYETAFIKANHIKTFICATLSVDIDNSDKLRLIVEESHAFGIEIHAPNINISEASYSVHDDEIYYGMAAIAKIGWQLAKNIATKRKEHGQFKSVIDFLEKTNELHINNGQLKALCYSGAFDKIAKDRDTAYNQCMHGIRSNTGLLIQQSDEYIYNNVSHNNVQLAVLEYAFLGINAKYFIPVMATSESFQGILIDIVTKKNKNGNLMLCTFLIKNKIYYIYAYEEIKLTKGQPYKIFFISKKIYRKDNQQQDQNQQSQSITRKIYKRHAEIDATNIKKITITSNNVTRDMMSIKKQIIKTDIPHALEICIIDKKNNITKKFSAKYSMIIKDNNPNIKYE